jgi:cytoplasmic iron level regulating protein YaaA (DUF328/UPF0246 family)
MLILLSPSKAQAFDGPSPARAFSEPAMLDESQLLIKELRKLTTKAISKLMDVSEKIATLNRARYQEFHTPFTPENARQAAFAFKGAVYEGLDADTLDEEALAFAQTHIRILSGLYGVLRPLDLIQAYRLEMSIRLKNPRGRDLYKFWHERLTHQIGHELEASGSRIVVNLASEEYFRAVDMKALNATLVTPQFKEKKDTGYKMIGLVAKKARGQMARYISQQRITHPEALQFFAEDGYRLNVALSRPDTPVYTRDSAAPRKQQARKKK